MHSVMHSFGLTMHVLVPPAVEEGEREDCGSVYECGAENVVGDTS